MADVMTKGGHPKNSSPIPQLIGIVDLGQEIMNVVRNIFSSGNYIEHTIGKLHHTKGMLEAAVSGTWVDQIGKRQLMNMTETLQGRRRQDTALVRIESNEHMNRIADFMDSLSHSSVKRKLSWSLEGLVS